jgi:hypothetical protein
MVKLKTFFSHFSFLIEVVAAWRTQEVLNELPPAMVWSDELHVDGLVFHFQQRSKLVVVGYEGNAAEEEV